MKYRALISTIVVLLAVGIISALAANAFNSGSQALSAEQLAQQTDTMPEVEPLENPEPTEAVEPTDTATYYRGERLMRETARCEYGDCLFIGGGGLVGLTSVEAVYTMVQRQGFEGETEVCPAIYVKRGPRALLEDSKIERFASEDGALIIPISETQTASSELWDLITTNTTVTAPLSLNVFIPDAREAGVATCHSPLYILSERLD